MGEIRNPGLASNPRRRSFLDTQHGSRLSARGDGPGVMANRPAGNRHAEAAADLSCGSGGRCHRPRGGSPRAEDHLEHECGLQRRRSGGRRARLLWQRNLKVERVNFAGATDQLLELLASGKADAGVGMALGWLKPLEQGFDVKLTAAIHGGCIRLLTTPESGIASVAG